MKTKILSLLALILFSGISQATSYTLNSNTSWSAYNWSTVSNGDIIVVNSGVTLTIDVTNATSLQSKDVIIEVYGTLDFNGTNPTDRNLFLSANSAIMLYGTGSLTASGAGSCSQFKKRIFLNGGISTNDVDAIATCTGETSAGANTTNSFSEINAAGGINGAGPLPVSWVDYSVQLELNQNVVVEWSTATEINNNYFEVEYSVDGQNWSAIAKIESQAANGNSAELLNYSIKHSTLGLSGNLYYRIKQVDFNGEFDYTDIMSVSLNEKPVITIQTLGSGKVNVISDLQGSLKTISLLSLNGEIIETVTTDSDYSFTAPKSGVYIITLSSGNQHHSIKQYIQ